MAFNGYARMVMTLERKAVVVHGTFLPAGASAPTGVSGRGVASVTRSSAGLFLVTLKHIWQTLLAANVSFQMAAATDVVPQIGVVTLASKTIEIRSLAAAVATDIAANAGNIVRFAFTFNNTTAPSL